MMLSMCGAKNFSFIYKNIPGSAALTCYLNAQAINPANPSLTFQYLDGGNAGVLLSPRAT